MANTVLTTDIIAAESVMHLENNLVMSKLVFRGYENEFDKKVNGYKAGDTITIRKPTDFTVRDGAVMAAQDVTEGTTTLTVNKRKGVDFKFTSQDLTLKVGEISERFLKPAMIQLANQVDVSLMDLGLDVPNWVGTPASPINSWADFAKAPERLDEYAVPQSGRGAVLSPADHWGFLGSQTALYMQGAAKSAYSEGEFGMPIANVNLHMDQNVPTLTVGSRTGSILVDLSIITTTVTYASVKDADLQTIHIDALGGATETIKRGEVFTIADVWAVNPVSKARLPFLKQFVVTADAVGSGSECDLIISPAMIWTGPFKNVDITAVTDLNNQAVTFMGTASTGYKQNLVFNKNAFALVMVPLVDPPGAVQVSRKSHKGVSVRVIPVYDGINDESAWRLDILYGTKTIDPRQATRLSGTT